MGMPSTIEVVDQNAEEKDIQKVFNYFLKIDNRFSTYKTDSEISKINRGEIDSKNYSHEMKKILKLCEETKKETNGYFDIKINGKFDPSGLVKGYTIFNGANLLTKLGYKNFYVEIAGDIEIRSNKKWKIGIKNPFNTREIVKVLNLTNGGVATSGNYERGKHILNPIEKNLANEIASITIIGPNVYEADRMVTAAFAMGEKGVNFIAHLSSFECYMIKKDKTAVYTPGFEKYL